MTQGRHTALTIQLTADERQTLEGWQRSPTIPARRARRGRMLLLLAAQVPVSDIARTVGCTRYHVYKWAQRFLAAGLAGLADQRRGRPLSRPRVPAG
jgi:biotin operon repressor